MKAIESNLVVYGTPSQPYDGSESVDYPLLATASGVEQLNQTIERLAIDALWPQRSALHDLSGVACAVHVAARPEILELIDDKGRFNKWLADDPYRPHAVSVLGAAGVEEALANWQDDRPVCVKPVYGVNGSGYWRLMADGRSLLDEPDEREIHPDIYLAALQYQENRTAAQPMIVMDWLPGPEVSVDVLSWYGQPLIHAARTKLSSTHQRVESDHPVIEHVYAMVRRLQLHGITSMQYRLDEERNWKMLEINPRPAGGSINSEDAGFGIIAAWTSLITGSCSTGDIRQYYGSVDIEIRRVVNKR